MTRRLIACLSLAAGITLGAAPWTPPRTAWGDPDLQGTWPGTAMMGVPLERPPHLGDKLMLSDEEFAARAAQAQRQAAADTEEFVAPAPAPAAILAGAGSGPPGHWGERGRPQRQTSLVVDPPNGRIPPMTADGEKRTAAIPAGHYYDNSGGGVFNGPEDLSVYDRCISRGLIGSMVAVGYNAGNQIVQGPGWVALRNEMIHEARLIPLDGRPHAPPSIRSYMGDSRGRWDGTTLVVDTTNFNGRTGVGANGRAIYHSDALHVIERFTRTDADTIQYEAIIEDAQTWTRPFTIAFPLKRDPGYGMFEYACHEGNYGLRNILSAARAGDKASTAQAGRPAQRLTSSQVTDIFVTFLEEQLAETADAMPADKYAFAPTAGAFNGVRTFGQQVKHLAATNYILAAGILRQPPPADAGNETGPETVRTKAEILAYLKGSFAALHKAVATIDDQNAVIENVPISPLAGKATRLGLAQEALIHVYDHYGQMVVYLRMNGIIPPSSR